MPERAAREDPQRHRKEQRDMHLDCKGTFTRVSGATGQCTACGQFKHKPMVSWAMLRRTHGTRTSNKGIQDETPWMETEYIIDQRDNKGIPEPEAQADWKKKRDSP